MPKRYPRTEETYDVLRNHVGSIAKEYPCCDSYISAIKNGDSNDIYAQFRQLFRAASDAGAPVEVWLRDLNGIVERRKVMASDAGDLIKHLSGRMLAEADSTSKILDAISDHDLDRSECHRILQAREISRDLGANIDRIVSARLAEFSKSDMMQASK